MTGNRNDYRFRDDERGHYENSGHHTFTGNRDDYRFKDAEGDITGTQAIARLPGIAVATNTGTNTGTMRGNITRTQDIAIRFKKFVMATKTESMRNIQMTIIIQGRDIVRGYNEKRRYDWFEEDY